MQDGQVLLQVLLPYLEDPGDKAVCTIAGISQQCRKDVKAYVAGNITKFLERALAKQPKDWEKVSVGRLKAGSQAVSCAALHSSSCKQYMRPVCITIPTGQWDTLKSSLPCEAVYSQLDWEMLCCYECRTYMLADWVGCAAWLGRKLWQSPL